MMSPLSEGRSVFGCPWRHGGEGSTCCPVCVQSAKSGQAPVIAFVTAGLSHQLTLELELWQSAEGAPPEQVGLDRRE